MESGYVGELEPDLGHLLWVGLRSQRSFGEKNRTPLGGDAKLVKGVMPDIYDVSGSDPMSDRRSRGRRQVGITRTLQGERQSLEATASL